MSDVPISKRQLHCLVCGWASRSPAALQWHGLSNHRDAGRTKGRGRVRVGTGDGRVGVRLSGGGVPPMAVTATKSPKAMAVSGILPDATIQGAVAATSRTPAVVPSRATAAALRPLILAPAEPLVATRKTSHPLRWSLRPLTWPMPTTQLQSHKRVEQPAEERARSHPLWRRRSRVR